MPTISQEILSAALAGLEAQRAKIDDHIAQVRTMLGTHSKQLGRPQNTATSEGDGVSSTPFGKRRTFSTATRKKMAAAQKARWARLKRPDQESAAPAPKKRTMSAEGRKRIAEAARKRWAAIRKRTSDENFKAALRLHAPGMAAEQPVGSSSRLK